MPNSPNNVFETIDHAYYELTAAERKTADFVIKNRERTQYLSISELAEESGVAEATISRFCRRLGYKGYNAFKLAIANAGATARGAGEDSRPIRETDGILDLANKLYGKTRFSVDEAILLSERFFPDCEIRVLFRDGAQSSASE